MESTQLTCSVTHKRITQKPEWTLGSPEARFWFKAEVIGTNILHFRISISDDLLNDKTIRAALFDLLSFFEQQYTDFYLIINITGLHNRSIQLRQETLQIFRPLLIKARLSIIYQPSTIIKNLVKLFKYLKSDQISLQTANSYRDAIQIIIGHEKNLMSQNIDQTPLIEDPIISSIAELIWAGKYEMDNPENNNPDKKGDLKNAFIVLQREFELLKTDLNQKNAELERLNLSLEEKIKERTHQLENEITHRIELEKSLRKSETRYRAVAEAIADYACAVILNEGEEALWEWESVPYESITGYTHEEIKQLGGSAYLIHPDDQKARQMREEMNKHGRADMNEYRIIRKDGEIRWLRDYTLPIWNDDKTNLIRIYGATQDITEQKLAEIAEREARETAELLHNTAVELTSSLQLETVLDKLTFLSKRLGNFEHNQIFLRNDQVLTLLDDPSVQEYPLNQFPLLQSVITKKETIITTPLNDIYHPNPDINLNGKTWIGIPIRSGEQVFGVLSIIPFKTQVINEQQIRLYTTFAGQAALALGNANLFAQVQKIAAIDPLTQIYNRRKFFELGEKLFSQPYNKDAPVAVLMFDIDKFKHINDTYGHLTGDQVLINVANLCKEKLRESDIYCRYGGDEFAVLLPFTTLKEVEKIAARLREAINALNIQIQGKEFNISTSVGYTIRTKEDQTLSAVLDLADQGLYCSKQNGGNQIYFYLE